MPQLKSLKHHQRQSLPWYIFVDFAQIIKWNRVAFFKTVWSLHFNLLRHRGRMNIIRGQIQETLGNQRIWSKPVEKIDFLVDDTIGKWNGRFFPLLTFNSIDSIYSLIDVINSLDGLYDLGFEIFVIVWIIGSWIKFDFTWNEN